MTVVAAEEIATTHWKQAEAFVAECAANGGLAPIDLDGFWADQEIAAADPFGEAIPQCAMGGLWSAETVFDELGEPENWYAYYHDKAWLAGLCKRFNEKAKRIVGRAVLDDTAPDPARQYPEVKMLHHIFEAKNVFHNESFWLQQAVEDVDDLPALLDRVEKRLENLRAFVLPENWEEEKARLTALGVQPPLYRHQRGPVTFATSILGTEEFLLLGYDDPDLLDRLSRVMLRAMLELGRVLDEEHDPAGLAHHRRFVFCDDNCCLMTPDLYDRFAYPILKGMFDHYAPGPEDWRYQHSDSAMGHLLPILGRLDFSQVNFGPTVAAEEIRAHMPRTIIQGQLAPFTYSRNQEVRIVAEFLRDFEATKEKRGLLFTTAGSINNGSRLSGARLIMAAIQRFGRFA